MICQFQNQHELDYASKTADVLKQVADMRNTMNEKNVSTSLDNTPDDIQEAREAKTETGTQFLLHNRSNQHAKASGRTLNLGGSQI